MEDIPIKTENGLKKPEIGEENKHKKEKKKIKEEDLTEREKEIIEERKKNSVALNFGNIDIMKVKLLEAISMNQINILNQLKEMNFYLKNLRTEEEEVNNG